MLALFAVAMLAILGMAGLGLDAGHFTVQYSRLQNTLDAAALAGAKSLAETGGDEVTATQHVNLMFANNADNAGHAALNTSYTSGQLSINIQYSNTLIPWAPGTIPARYVRVSGSNFRVPGSFTQLLGFADAPLETTAVAGPSPRLTRICNIAPMMVCGDPAAGAGQNWGYNLGEPDVLKTGSTNGNFEVGPGNFQLVRLPGNAGAADIRRALAGDFNACVDLGEDIDTEPGNSVGPVVQGLNTRLGVYSGPISPDDYPPDVIVKQANHGLPGNETLDYDAANDEISYDGTVITSQAEMDALGLYHHGDYESHLIGGVYDNQPNTASPPGPGAFGRRTLAMPIGDCSTTTNGQGTLPLLGVMCFHLLQQVEQQGNESHVYGQFIGSGCGVTGNPGDEPNDESGPFVIQLYKDPTTSAS